MSSRFTFIDLFAGIGGMRIGAETLGGRCVFSSEIDKFARKTYLANFTCTHHMTGDIREVDASDIPDHTILYAGFPCQPFSIAGVSKRNWVGEPHGFEDTTKGTLFFDIARIIDTKRPQVVVLENVPNICSHDEGRTFHTIFGVLHRDLGYHVSHRKFSARYWVPQNRNRVFIVCFREWNGFCFDEIRFPNHYEIDTVGEILHDGQAVEEPYTNADGSVADKYTLTDHQWNQLLERQRENEQKGRGFKPGLIGHNDVARTLLSRYYRDGNEILIAQERRNPRKLTPRECARIMGFERPGGKRFNIPVSDTQAYKQFGNAVVPQSVRFVTSHILPWIQ